MKPVTRRTNSRIEELLDDNWSLSEVARILRLDLIQVIETITRHGLSSMYCFYDEQEVAELLTLPNDLPRAFAERGWLRIRELGRGPKLIRFLDDDQKGVVRDDDLESFFRVPAAWSFWNLSGIIDLDIREIANANRKHNGPWMAWEDALKITRLPDADLARRLRRYAIRTKMFFGRRYVKRSSLVRVGVARPEQVGL